MASSNLAGPGSTPGGPANFNARGFDTATQELISDLARGAL